MTRYTKVSRASNYTFPGWNEKSTQRPDPKVFVMSAIKHPRMPKLKKCVGKINQLLIRRYQEKCTSLVKRMNKEKCVQRVQRKTKFPENFETRSVYFEVRGIHMINLVHRVPVIRYELEDFSRNPDFHFSLYFPMNNSHLSWRTTFVQFSQSNSVNPPRDRSRAVGTKVLT